MSSVNSLIKSKVGRRFFLLFLVTALVPVILLAVITYQQVSNQIYKQTTKSLYKESKAIGMEIHQRLNFLETEIGMQLQKRESKEQLIFYNFDDEIGSKLKQKFKSLSWFDSKEFSTNISSNFGKQLVLDITRKLSDKSQFFQLLEHSDNAGNVHFFGVGLFIAEDDSKMYLLGEIDSGYLWRTDTISEDESACVFNESLTMLYCSQPNGNEFFEAYAAHKKKFKRGLFEWSKDNEYFMSNSWEVFLGDHELIDNWTIVFSKSKKSVFNEIDNFRTTFVIIMLLVLILIILISIKQIRNVLIPLQLLKDGAIRLSNNDFTGKISLNSNDEFNELAGSFNNMSDELSRKFKDLKVISEIDKVILSENESAVMCKHIIKFVCERVNADAICVAVFDQYSEHAIVHLLEVSTDNEVMQLQVNIPENEIKQYLSCQNGMIVSPKKSPLLLASFFEKMGGSSLFIYPIMIDNELMAVCGIGYHADILSDHLTFEKARSWVEKIGMALSKSAWQEKLYHQAHYDSLTNLPNRLALKDFLHNVTHRAEQYDSKIAVLFIDLDRFKVPDRGSVNPTPSGGKGQYGMLDECRIINMAVIQFGIVNITWFG